MNNQNPASAITGEPAHDEPTGLGLMTAADVADVLQVPTSWVYAEARAGRIPHIALGRYRRFRRVTIDAWIDEREQR